MTLIGRTVGAGRRHRRDREKPAAMERESRESEKPFAADFADERRFWERGFHRGGAEKSKTF
jgi:hypothetical protein